MATTPKRTPAAVAASLKEIREANKRKAQAQGEALRKIAAVERGTLLIDALERLILDGGALRFRSLPDLLAPQPWAVARGVVLGHLLTMEEGEYLAVLNEEAVEAMSLDAALRMEWADGSEHQAWAGVYTQALRLMVERVEEDVRARHEQSELQRATADAVGERPTSDPPRRGGL